MRAWLRHKMKTMLTQIRTDARMLNRTPEKSKKKMRAHSLHALQKMPEEACNGTTPVVQALMPSLKK